MTIRFFEPAGRPHKSHPNESFTPADLARILEAKYGLIDLFVKWAEKDIIKHMLYKRRHPFELHDFILEKWRDFIRFQFHGIMTGKNRRVIKLYQRLFGFKGGISPKEAGGKVPFIDTGDYYKSLRVSLKFSPEEEKAVKYLRRYAGTRTQSND